VLPTWFGVVVLVVGAVSAVGGITYALFQHELKRLLAMSSIENIGIMVLGLGACLLLRAHDESAWAALALAAALLHMVNHAVFKALLFLCAGSIEQSVGSLELNRLGGLLRRMPWTGPGFVLGLKPGGDWAYWFGSQQATYHALALPAQMRVCADGQGVNVRETASETAATRGLIKDGTIVTADRFVLTQPAIYRSPGPAGNGWYSVSGPTPGFVRADFLSVTTLPDCKLRDALETGKTN